ncbi:hypothetical protein MFLAVUS_007806 [Mucor flavus]|uniref:Cytochrome P450 n=1 Tax=Mucor flavus TaxID=439312 RepID=A0ABP9Z5D4_9FUNG
MYSLLENNYFQVQLTGIVKLYSGDVLPRLNKKNTVILIGSAVALSFAYIIRDNLFKPPKNLRHIPYFGYFSVIKSVVVGQSLFDRGYRTHVPFADSRRDGLYLEPGKSGWEVHVSNAADIKQILLKHELFPKEDFSLGCERTLLCKFVAGRNIGTTTGPEWIAQRKVVNPAFRRSMPVKLFGNITQQLFETMDTMDQTVNVSDMMIRCTLEAIGKAGFGFDFDAVRNNSNNKWTSMYYSLGDAFCDYKYFIFPSLDQKLLWLFPKRRELHRKLDTFMGMLDEVVQNKRKLMKQGQNTNQDLEENERDLLTLMLESEEKGEGALSNEELKSNLCVFFLAGHDTTAAAITFALYYLAKYPEIQQRAREEAISILGDEPKDVLPTGDETKQMNYINQVIKESLRISDPVARLFIPRIPTEDTMLSGTFIPKGTKLVMNIFNVHHSSKFWKNPRQFDPDRFAINDESKMAWVPFGSGARQCIGKYFSLNEQRVMISMLLRKYSWTLPDDSIHKDEIITSGVPIVSVKGGVHMKFQRRY